MRNHIVYIQREYQPTFCRLLWKSRSNKMPVKPFYSYENKDKWLKLNENYSAFFSVESAKYSSFSEESGTGRAATATPGPGTRQRRRRFIKAAGLIAGCAVLAISSQAKGRFPVLNYDSQILYLKFNNRSRWQIFLHFLGNSLTGRHIWLFFLKDIV